MLQDFQNIFSLSISLGDILTNLAAALVSGIIIGIFYKTTYRGTAFSVSFINALVVLVMITSIVIMVIGNNLATAFGLVGAMSIIRFRTAVKEILDIIYIFFALAIGMAAGTGQYAVALTGTLVVGTVLVILTRFNVFPSAREEYLLQFYYITNDGSDDTPYMEVINKYCRAFKLINVKSTGNGGIELSYYVNLKNKEKNPEFIKELKSVGGLNHINLFFDEEHF